jgi:hypothetical protein
MRNRIALFLIAVVIAVAFYGCSSLDTGGGIQFATGNDKGSGTADQNYNKGTTGLKLDFLTNSPPSELFDGQTFPFVLEIYNIGITDVNPYITLTGFDKNIISANWANRQPGIIPGKSQLNPTGGYASVEDNVKVTLPTGVNTFSTPLTAIACYEYVTQAVSQVCVDPDPTNNRDDVCAAKLIQLSGGQGAPVGITKIDTRPTIGMTYFIITISNLDKTGAVIKYDKVSTCIDQLTYQDVDAVDVMGANLGSQSISCTPTTIKLVNGLGTITCQATGLTGSAYSSSLQLNLRYGYKTSITKSLNIRRM